MHSLFLSTSSIILWICVFSIIFIYITPSLRNIKIPGKAEFSNITIGALLLSGIFTAGFLYWSIYETSLYKTDTSFISYFGEKSKNNPFLTAMSIYHWVLPLTIFMFASTIIAYFFYSNIEKMQIFFSSKIGKIIRISAFVFITPHFIFAFTASLIPTLFIIDYLNIGYIYILLFTSSFFILAIISAYFGLQGLATFAKLALTLIILYIITITVKLYFKYDIIGYFLNTNKYLIYLVFNLEYIKDQIFISNNYIKNWTAFFWAFWLGTIPAQIIFAVRLAKGKTLKELINIYIFYAIIPTYLLFLLVSSMAHIIIDIHNLTSENTKYLIFYILDFFPFPTLIAILYLFSWIIFNVTSLDSIAYIMATKIIGFKEKSKEERIFVILFFLFAYISIIFILYNFDPFVISRLNSFNTIIGPILILPFFFFLYYFYNIVKTKKY